jgi:uncharacterized integral membrane protein
MIAAFSAASYIGLGVLILVTIFVGLNLAVFSARVHLNLLMTSVDAPIGAVLLILLALMVGALLLYVGAWQGTFAREFRRQARELESQRALAEQAEASRFTELRVLVQTEMTRSTENVEAALAGLRGELRDTERSLAATLAEFDDRVMNLLRRRQP